MNSLTSAGWVVRAAGLTMIVLGLLIWAGVAPGLVPVHILVGIVLVLALAATAILALRVGARPVLPAVAIAWGAFMLVFGLTQAQILRR